MLRFEEVNMDRRKAGLTILSYKKAQESLQNSQRVSTPCHIR
ncbi:hypothetical protein MFFC18_48620 [Mariniblastus fucicola]|uniref:Uncharacterized protein n=1 Tax=Mariniblastus fucicola TaxID=980251 RepID=A0A5B9PH59_9BACT|nr:hypothetical protein MFFC18_48620 [Mariniblastus fucicola]